MKERRMSAHFYLTQAGLIYMYLLFFNIKSKSGTDKSQITILYSLRTSKEVQQLVGWQQFHNARTEKYNSYFQKTLCVYVCFRVQNAISVKKTFKIDSAFSEHRAIISQF